MTALIPLIKKYLFGLYGLCLICFLLPFATISCDGRPVVRVTGSDLVFGKELKEEAASGGSRVGPSGARAQDVNRRTGSYASAITAGLLAVVGLVVGVFGLARRNPSAVPHIPIAAVAVVALLVLMVTLHAEIRDEAARERMPLAVQFNVGYWGALLSLLAVLGLAVFAAVCSSRTDPAPSASSPPERNRSKEPDLIGSRME